MNFTESMPFRFQRLLLLFLLVYLAIFHLSDFVNADDLSAEASRFVSPRSLTLLVFTGLSFFSYALFCYTLLYFFFDRIPWVGLLLLLVAGIVGCMFLRAFLEEVIVKALTGWGNYNPNMSWRNYLLDQILYMLIFTPLGVVFYFVQRARFQESARRETEALRVATELKFLRSQVNPHFLFNTLNNLYALVHQSSPLALPALEKLSGLLRYALYEKGELVPIAREVAYLKDLVHLEQIRVEGIAPVALRVAKFRQPWCLPPLLLVPFVENAFKHGDLRSAPLEIELWEDEADNFRCVITNHLPRQPRSKDETGGIGLANVRKRLLLLYPAEHTLTITAGADTFRVELTLLRAAARRCREMPEEPRRQSSPSLTLNA